MNAKERVLRRPHSRIAQSVPNSYAKSSKETNMEAQLTHNDYSYVFVFHIEGEHICQFPTPEPYKKRKTILFKIVKILYKML